MLEVGRQAIELTVVIATIHTKPRLENVPGSMSVCDNKEAANRKEQLNVFHTHTF
jgi:hypothetical protein